jgi:hypothetical protein
MTGTILSVDVDSKTLRFETAKRKKPLLLDWNKDTEFSNGSEVIKAGQIGCPVSAAIDYKDLTFRHPLLKKVVVAITGEPPAAAAGH